MDATCNKLIPTFCQAKHDKWVAREIKSQTRLRAKGHRDFIKLSDESIARSAEMLARTYSVGTVYTRVPA